MDLNGKHFDLWRAKNEDHDIIFHAEDAEEAITLIDEGYPEGIGEFYLSRADETQYPDLQLGIMRDLKGKRS